VLQSSGIFMLLEQ